MDYHNPKSEVPCPVCGKKMRKRKYSRWHSGNNTVYQWRCVWSCKGVIFVDYQGNVVPKPKGKH